jgi:CotH kinase protein
VPVLVAAALALAALVAPAARADEAAPLFDPGAVYVIHLKLPKSSEEKLEADPEGEYQPGEFSIAATSGTPGSEGAFSTPVKAEIRLKGHDSFENLSGKAAFKLKFKKGERPFGLKKMTLNNMVDDPSMTHETLAYEVAREAGVPASRTGFADVYVNGHDYGMHLDIETVDEQALERMFGTPFDPELQHLYEGEEGADVIPGDEHEIEVDEGSETDIADLEALIAAVNGSGPEPWSVRVAPFVDLTEMTRMWAMEKYTGQWDGYSGVVGKFQPSNYYLYDDIHGTFQMIPWGTDETFESEKHLAFEGPAGILFDKCLEDSACTTDYWHSLTTVLATAKGLELPAKAAAVETLLTPWQNQEQSDGRFPYTRAEAHAAALETEEYATERIGEAESWLAAHPPPEETGGAGGGGGVQPTGSSGTSSEGPPVLPLSSPIARVHYPREHGHSLTTMLTLSSSSSVGQRGTFESDGSSRLACSVRSSSHQVGPLTLRCPLRPDALRQLRTGALHLLLVTTARSDSGAVTVLRRHVTLHPPRHS